MEAKLLQSMDVTGGSFELLLAVMAGSTVVLLLGTGWVGKKWKLPVGLAATVTFVSALYYYQARGIWLDAEQMPVIYRYIAWLIAMPVQVVALYFFINAIGTLRYGLFWRLLIAALIMVLARYMGQVGYLYPVLGFLIGVVAWLYVLGEVFFGRLGELNTNSGDEIVRTGFFWLRLIVTVGWGVYPLCEFVANFGGSMTEGDLSIVYNLADLVNQMAFGMIILAVALNESYSARG